VSAITPQGAAPDPEFGASGSWLDSMIQFRPIGLIRTPFPDVEGMPIQPGASARATGLVELIPCLADGLQDIEQFSHLTLVWYMHRAGEESLRVVPFLDDQPHGIFATRAPARPNPIGISVVRLVSVDGARLHVEDLDMVDGTPLLDIKPYVPAFDNRSPARIGWYDGRLDHLVNTTSDRRFAAP
jgi:tRNA-Thr(GGU) m(6)t(6)A37 methyltransferase TsaA